MGYIGVIAPPIFDPATPNAASRSEGGDYDIFTHDVGMYGYCTSAGLDFEDGNAPPVTSANVGERARAFVADLLVRAGWSLTPHVMFPFGCDFRFHDAPLMFDNMEAVIAHVNGHGASLLAELNATDAFSDVAVSYSTLGEYVDAVYGDASLPPLPFVSGTDYIPYDTYWASDGPPYTRFWSGFFTSRPALKQQSRGTDALLRATEALVGLVAVEAAADGGAATDWDDVVPPGWRSALTAAREATATLQHHDAITGTAKSFVVDDYAGMLADARAGLEPVAAAAIGALLGDGVTVQRVRPFEGHTQGDGPVTVAVFNPIAVERTEWHRVAVASVGGIEVR